MAARSARSRCAARAASTTTSSTAISTGRWRARAARPVASGRVSVAAAWIWLLALCLVGLVVLLQLRWPAQLVALASLAPVAAYPFMKRITWWPQAWLGLVFSWGALVGWTAAARSDRRCRCSPLYAGAIAWVIGYDTIYALQDREDDALVGVKSSARRLGDKAPQGVALFYAIGRRALEFGHLGRSAGLACPRRACTRSPPPREPGLRADPQDGEGALRLFRSNRTTRPADTPRNAGRRPFQP